MLTVQVFLIISGKFIVDAIYIYVISASKKENNNTV